MAFFEVFSSTWWRSQRDRSSSRLRKLLAKENFLLTDEACRLEQHAAFSRLGWDYEGALKRLNSMLKNCGMPQFDSINGSQHWVVFAALLQTLPAPTRILEIGTFDGGFTLILAKLFPQSEIITVDLADDHPQVRSSYQRGDNTVFKNFLARRSANLVADNITFIQKNSFLLPTLALNHFDLIWLDGDHAFPALAWDFCNAYHVLRDGGTLVCDDVFRFPKNDLSPKAHSRIILDYLAAENLFTVNYVLKRVARVHAADPWHRKYLGVLRK